MKKFNKFGFASAIVLAGAMGFAACSSDDEEFVELNPTFDGNSVKTQFAISLTNKVKGQRMTANKAQEDNEFNGMKGIQLYHFTVPVSAGTETSSAVTGLEAISADGFNYNGTGKINAKIYNNVAIAPGVKHFLFYGETDIENNEGKTAAVYASANAAVTGTTFTPVSIKTDKANVTNTAGQSFSAAQYSVVTRLNSIVDEIEAAEVPTSIKAIQNVILKQTAGSSEALRELVKDVYTEIKTQYNDMPVNATHKGATAKLLADILSIAGLADNFEWVSGKNPEFPTAWGLPQGAVALEVNNGKLAVKTDSDDGLTTAISNYVYPASLFYYANTPAGVRNASYFDVVEDANKTNNGTWSDVVANFNQAEVSQTTRSVILWDQVQYGVARLETTVKFGNASSIPSWDNNNPVNITDKEFPVTGVLVGGQKQVGWNFSPTTANANDQYVIWDGTMTAGANMVASSAESSKNHTLVYETASGAVVNIAIELENNSGADFKGVNGCVVPAGAKFYLVANLDPTAATGVTKPTLPGGGTAAIDQVFKQDYVTKANLTITSLKNAYNVIPNLEQPELEFGVSVNLEWTPGLQFDVNVE